MGRFTVSSVQLFEKINSKNIFFVIFSSTGNQLSPGRRERVKKRKSFACQQRQKKKNAETQSLFFKAKLSKKFVCLFEFLNCFGGKGENEKNNGKSVYSKFM